MPGPALAQATDHTIKTSDGNFGSHDSLKYCLLAGCFVFSAYFAILPGRARNAQALVGSFCFMWLMAPLFSKSTGASVVSGAALSAYLGAVVFLRFPRQMAPLSYILAFGAFTALVLDSFSESVSRDMIFTCIFCIGSSILASLSVFFPKHFDEPFAKGMAAFLALAGADSLSNFGIVGSANLLFRDVALAQKFFARAYPVINARKHRALRGALVISIPIFAAALIGINYIFRSGTTSRNAPPKPKARPRPRARPRPQNFPVGPEIFNNSSH